MKKTLFVTYVTWSYNGHKKCRAQEHFDINNVDIYVRNLNLDRVIATTYVYDGEDLIDIIEWNKIAKGVDNYEGHHLINH